MDSSDAEVIRRLRESVGGFFAERMVHDSAWAGEVLGGPSSDDVLPTACSSDRGIIVSTLPRMRDHALVFTIFVRALYCFPISFGARVL